MSNDQTRTRQGILARKPGRLRSVLLGLAVVLIALGLPFVVGPTLLDPLIFFCLYLVVAVTFSLLAGHLNYINLGHGVFLAVGGYAFVILSYKYGFPIWVGVLAAPLCSGLVALVIAPAVFRTRGMTFALATLALIPLAKGLATNLEITGGQLGISFQPLPAMPAYYMALVVACATIIFYWVLLHSRYGLAWRSIGGDERVAESLGIRLGLYKTVAFVASAIPCGLAGAVYVWYTGYANPSVVLNSEMSFGPLIMAMLGGVGTLAGPIVGSAAYVIVSYVVFRSLGVFQTAILGVAVIAVGVFVAGGLVRTPLYRRVAGVVTGTARASRSARESE